MDQRCNPGNQENEEKYSCLAQSTISPQFMNTCSTHSHPFDAIAEIVDNAKDAKARNFEIFVGNPKGLPYLKFYDDGEGMSPEEAVKVISFGHSVKKDDKIGRYGNGLKQGAFHLGSELLVLTKKEEKYTALMISKKFHDDNSLTSAVFVPCPSWDLDFNEICATRAKRNIYEMEKNLILHYAPLDGECAIEKWNNLMDLFKKIEYNGTMVIIGGLRMNIFGEYILNVEKSDATKDITVDIDGLPLIKTSLRFYLERIYLNATMKMHICGEPVRSLKIVSNWVARHLYSFQEKDARMAEGRTIDDIEKGLKKVIKAIKDATKITKKNIHAKDSNGKLYRDILSENGDEKFELEDRLKRIERDRYHVLELKCGIDIFNRTQNGIHIYFRKRLILWGYKDLQFFKNPKSIGITAYLNLDSDNFLPHFSKTDLGEKKSFDRLMKTCSRQLDSYMSELENQWLLQHLRKELRVVGIRKEHDVWLAFWNSWGFSSMRPNCPWTDNGGDLTDQIHRFCAYWYSCRRCGRWWRRDTPVGDENNFVCKVNGDDKCIDDDTDDEMFTLDSVNRDRMREEENERDRDFDREYRIDVEEEEDEVENPDEPGPSNRPIKRERSQEIVEVASGPQDDGRSRSTSSRRGSQRLEEIRSPSSSRRSPPRTRSSQPSGKIDDDGFRTPSASTTRELRSASRRSQRHEPEDIVSAALNANKSQTPRPEPSPAALNPLLNKERAREIEQIVRGQSSRAEEPRRSHAEDVRSPEELVRNARAVKSPELVAARRSSTRSHQDTPQESSDRQESQEDRHADDGPRRSSSRSSRRLEESQESRSSARRSQPDETPTTSRRSQPDPEPRQSVIVSPSQSKKSAVEPETGSIAVPTPRSPQKSMARRTGAVVTPEAAASSRSRPQEAASPSKRRPGSPDTLASSLSTSVPSRASRSHRHESPVARRAPEDDIPSTSGPIRRVRSPSPDEDHIPSTSNRSTARKSARSPSPIQSKRTRPAGAQGDQAASAPPTESRRRTIDSAPPAPPMTKKPRAASPPKRQRTAQDDVPSTSGPKRTIQLKLKEPEVPKTKGKGKGVKAKPEPPASGRGKFIEEKLNGFLLATRQPPIKKGEERPEIDVDQIVRDRQIAISDTNEATVRGYFQVEDQLNGLLEFLKEEAGIDFDLSAVNTVEKNTLVGKLEEVNKQIGQLGGKKKAKK